MVFKNKFEHLSILFLYFILAVIFTYPLILFINNSILGIRGGDPWQFIWNLWWIKKSLVELHTNPYYTDYLFYPHETSLVFHTLSLFNGIISIPLQYFFNLVTVYNILIFFILVTSAYGMYLLVKYLTNNSLVSFLSGVFFSFNSFQLGHITEYLSLSSIQWLPFYFLFLFKTSKEKGYKNPLLAGVFLFFTALADWYLMIFLLILTFFVLYFLSFKEILYEKLFIKKMLVLFFSFFFMIFPFIFPLLIEYSEPYVKGYFPSIDQMKYFSSDISSFFIYWVSIYNYKEEGISFEANQTYIGYLLLILLFYSLYIGKLEKEAKFWLFFSVIFFLITPGPIFIFYKIKLFSNPIFSFIHSIPILNGILPYRFYILFIFSFILFISFGLKNIFIKIENKKLWRLNKKYFLIFFFLIIFFIEHYHPKPISSGQIPNVYKTLSNENYSILEVPISQVPYHGPFDADFMYYQTFHEKKIINGRIARVPPDSLETLKKLNFLYPDYPSDISNDDIRLFENLTTKYIIVHKSYDDYLFQDFNYPANFSEIIKNRLDKCFEEVYEDDYAAIFEIRRNITCKTK